MNNTGSKPEKPDSVPEVSKTPKPPAAEEEKHNTSYTIRVKEPLLRPGMEIEAGPVSEDYVVPTVKKLMDKIREINE